MTLKLNAFQDNQSLNHVQQGQHAPDPEILGELKDDGVDLYSQLTVNFQRDNHPELK